MEQNEENNKKGYTYDEFLVKFFPDSHEIHIVNVVKNDLTPEQTYDILIEEVKKYCESLK
jgi:hypothetical protein